MVATLIQPVLPELGEPFPLGERPLEDTEAIIIAAIWSTYEPDEGGIHTAFVVLLDPEAQSDERYSVAFLGYDLDRSAWFIFEQDYFFSLQAAGAHYSSLSGDD